MKRTRFLLLAILIPVCLFAQTQAPAASRGSSLDAATVERLAGFGRLWGLVKFCHPYPAARGIDWDQALIKTFPLVREAKTPEAYKAAVSALLSYLEDPGTFVIAAVGPEEESQTPAQTKAPGIQGNIQPRLERTDDGIAVIVANDYRQFSDENTAYAKIIADFKRVFKEAAKSKRVLIDLRNLEGSYSYLFSMAVSDSFSLIIGKDALMPPMRYLYHYGYSSQKEPMIYKSELTVRSGGVIRAMDTPASVPEKIVVLFNGKSYGLFMQMAALQDSGAVLLVQEGKESPPAFVPTISIDLPDGLRAVVRTAEFMRKGGEEFKADLVVDADALSAGLDVLRGKRELEREGASKKGRSGPSPLFSVIDKTYPEMSYPDRDYRLLALFRFWNVIDRFFPYKDLMDQPWDKTLLEFIPKMEAAKDALEYTLTVAELVARIQDSHGQIINPIYTQYTGRLTPAVQVGFVEGRSIITQVKDPALKKKGIEVGDIILSVDGENVEARRARLKPVIPASTPGRQESLIDMTILAGDGERPAKLFVKKASGKTRAVVLPRTLEVARIPDFARLPVVTVLPSGFGYIDLGRLLGSGVEEAIEKVKDTPGLVLDMRGYPVGGAFQLARRLAKKKKPFTQFSFPEFHGDGGYFSVHEETEYVWPAKNPFDYKGRIAVLIGPTSQSAAEHTCLTLEAAADVTFVGMPTSGANGNITYTVVPGNIILRFTGLGVRHGDGRQLQRMGIQPDIRVEPTIAGIRGGRDEVLERAEEFLRTGAKSQ